MDAGNGLELSCLKTLLSSSNVAITVLDKKGKFIEFSKGAEKLTGFKAKEVLGKSIEKFYKSNPRDLAKINALLMKQGKVENFETFISHKDGSKIPISITVIPLYDNKKFVGSVGISINISEKKSIENALKESEEKFRSLADQSPNMIFINVKGRITYVNEKCVEIIGYSKKEFYSKDFDFFSLIHPGSIHLIRKSSAAHMKGKDILPFECSLVTKSGRRIEAIVATKLIRYGGSTAILGLVTDITERKKAEEALKESEEKYRNLINNASEIIYKSDLKGNIIFINKKGLEVFGCKEKDVIGKNWLNFIKLIEINNSKPLEEYLKKGKNKFEVQTKIVGKDRKIVYLDHSVTINFDKKGKPISLDGVARDVTQKVKTKKLEQKINRIEERKVPLTKKEKKGFYGLVRYPSLNDNQLAKKIRLSRPTLTSIKNRLKKENYYSIMNIPRVDFLGCKMFSVFYTPLKNNNMDVKQFEILKQFPEIVFKVISETQLCLAYLTNDLGKFQKVHSEVLSKLNKNGVTADEANIIHFPFNISKFLSLFELSSLLNRRFDLNLFERPIKLVAPKSRKLTKKEKIVLYSLVNYPDMNISDLSKKINVARTTISLMKKRFIREGFLIPLVLPNFAKLGFELIEMCYVHLNNHFLKSDFNLSNCHILFAICGHDEICFFNIFENYTEFSKTKIKNTKLFEKMGVEFNETQHYLFPIEEIEIIEFNIAPLLKSLLGV